MSPRSSTVRPLAGPRRMATRPLVEGPSRISSGRPASAAFTLAVVFGRSRPSSGSAWMARRRAMASGSRPRRRRSRLRGRGSGRSWPGLLRDRGWASMSLGARRRRSPPRLCRCGASGLMRAPMDRPPTSTSPSPSATSPRRAPSTAACWAARRAARPPTGSTSISTATRSSPIWRRTRAADARDQLVDGEAVPVRHFGLILTLDDWRALAERLRPPAPLPHRAADPLRRRPGRAVDDVLPDPSGNALEFKAFADEAMIFAK